ncbi:hypothetical protein SAMN05444369_11644 [Capnocytophaga haemolytica]|uniref:Uncharacterized protein n=1 Tax=Capnocytophaga haemolytica TaxID=45243 RepID=A0AAX2H0E7_9FLAO|nr:hypothetical protein SAMN05444369_11644 [Capnocytophaga haemolytica]SNV14997.1 Uncharacterised protein [Capnocytophaga haemolytica]
MLHTFFITIFQEKFFTTLPSSFVFCYSSFLPFFRHYTPPLEVESDSWVCAPRERGM